MTDFLLVVGGFASNYLKSEVAQAEAQVKTAETNIDRLTMRAPIAGVILQNRVRLGQFEKCGPLSEPLRILGSVTPLHVRVDVDEHDTWRVRGGHWRRLESEANRSHEQVDTVSLAALRVTTLFSRRLRDLLTRDTHRTSLAFHADASLYIPVPRLGFEQSS